MLPPIRAEPAFTIDESCFLIIYYGNDYDKKKHSSVFGSDICGDDGLVLADP